MGCASNSDDISYDDFETLFNWEDIEALDESTYLIYYHNRDFFGTDCAGCQIVNETLFEYGFSNDEDVTLLLINERTVSGLKPLIFSGQPMIAVISNNEMITTVFSAAKIIELLDIMNEDDFKVEDLMTGEIE